MNNIVYQNAQSKDVLPYISVIVPVWNPGEEIIRCIDTLRNQTLRNIEMLFIDDCGTDDSMEHVARAAEEDSRIRIIRNPENLGVGAARNAGIDLANGLYLSFVDPDDYIAEDFLEKLFQRAIAKDLDIIKGKHSMESGDGTPISTGRDLNKRIWEGLAKKKPLYTLYTYEAHGTLFRREFIKTREIYFGLSARAQDTTFLLRACSRTDRFDIVDDAAYHFCERQESLMHRRDYDVLDGYLMSVHDKVEEMLLHPTIDSDAIGYLRGVFMLALREYGRYLEVDELHDSRNAYLEKLRDELLRLPCCEELVANSFYLRMLKDHYVGLPREPYRSPWEKEASPEAYDELLAHWCRVLSSRPGWLKAGRKELALLIEQAEHVYPNLTKKEIRKMPHSLRGYLLLRRIRERRNT